MVINKCTRFNIQGKAVMTLYKKYYAVDLGLKRVMGLHDKPDYGASLETVIYNEFIARGCKVYVGKTYKGEVDFLVIKGDKKIYVQVCYRMAEESTREREFSAFDPITDEYPKYVISMDNEDYSQNGIKHINVLDFLLNRVTLDI